MSHVPSRLSSLIRGFAVSSALILAVGCTPAQPIDDTTNTPPVLPDASSSSSEAAMMYQSSAADVMTASSAASSNSSRPFSASASSQPAVVSKKYRDGSYSAMGNYVSPAGTEEVTVSVTIADDKVSMAEFIGHATHPTSKKRQADFNAGFKDFVVGKPIDQVSLTVVNGSSLAPKGFMDALSKIKAEAKA